MLKLRKNKKGFSLVELIVVIAIMAILAGVVGGTLFSQLNKQKENTANIDAKNVATTIKTILLSNSNDSALINADGAIQIDRLKSYLTEEYPDYTLNAAGDAGKQSYNVTVDNTTDDKIVTVAYMSIAGDNKGHLVGYTYNYTTGKIATYSGT